jgi:hypothetical protein
MSGGRFNHVDRSLAYEIFDFTPNAKYGLGIRDGYQEDIKYVRRKNPFEDKVISEILYDVFCLINSYDYYASGDCCEETYLADIKYFKKKWLKPYNEKRVRELIDEELAEAKEELLKALVVNE